MSPKKQLFNSFFYIHFIFPYLCPKHKLIVAMLPTTEDTKTEFKQSFTDEVIKSLTTNKLQRFLRRWARLSVLALA